MSEPKHMGYELYEQVRKLAARSYSVRILRDDSVPDEPLYVALNPELEGCLAQAETIEQAIVDLDAFRVEYIEHLLQHGLPIPEPANTATITAGSSVENPWVQQQNYTFEGALARGSRRDNEKRGLEYSVTIK